MPGTLVFDYPSVAAMATFLHRQLARTAGAAAPPALPAPQAALAAQAGGAREPGQLLAVRSAAYTGFRTALAHPTAEGHSLCMARPKVLQEPTLFSLSINLRWTLCFQTWRHTLKTCGC